LIACEDWLAANRPRAAIVIGDTNSTLACALAASKSRVPVAHVEAGLYAADRLMAEEINRRAVDAMAEVLFAPCERVAAKLRRQYPDALVDSVGDVAYDVLRRAMDQAPPPLAVPRYDPAWGGGAGATAPGPPGVPRGAPPPPRGPPRWGRGPPP